MPERAGGPVWVGELVHHRAVHGTGRGAGDLVVPPRFGSARLLVTDGGVPVGQAEVPLHEGRARAADLARAAAAV
ncbi:hypothetical protein, partial [Pseudonocardia sp. SID8383]